MEYWTGIGSRSTPPPALELLEQVARVLADLGLVLRSGHADGADQACERGAGGDAEIYLPWSTYNSQTPIVRNESTKIFAGRPSMEAIQIAIDTHPFGQHLSERLLLMHGRSSHQVLGEDLRTPSKFVVCWTPDGSLDGSGRHAGGTGQALRVASLHDVQVFNIQRPDHYAAVAEYIASQGVPA